MVAQLYEVTPDLTVYCHDDCYADPWGAMPETVVLVHGALESSDAWRARLGPAASEVQIRYWTDFSLRQTDPRGRIEVLQAMGQTDLRGAFPHMRTPILLIGAEQNALTPAAQMRAWADLLPAGEFLEIPGDVFHVYVSAPDLCAAGVLDFIRRHPDKASGQHRRLS